jgi:hypothetical protein
MVVPWMADSLVSELPVFLSDHEEMGHDLPSHFSPLCFAP